MIDQIIYKKHKPRYWPAAIALSLLLAACSGGDEEAERRERFEGFTVADLEGFAERSEFEFLVEVLHYYRDEGKATIEHLHLLARAYIALHDGIAAETTVERLRARGVGEDATALTLARALMLQNRFRDAERSLTDKSVPEADLIDFFLLRGDLSRALDDLERAGSYYQAAIDSAPEDFRGYVAMTLLKLQQANLFDARTFAEAAAARTSDDTMLSYILGMVERYSGNTETAKAHFEQAIDLNRTNLLARLELAGIFLSNGDVEGARLQLREIYGLSPNNPHANYYRALIMINDGHTERAAELLLRTGDFTRTYPPAARLYGMASYQLGKYSAAIPYLRRALSIFPNDPELRIALADSQTRRGDSAEALKVLEPLVNEGDNIDAMVQAAAAAGGLGDLRSARTYIEKALVLAQGQGDMGPELLNSLKRRAAFARFLDNDTSAATELLTAMYQDDPTDSSTLAMKANLLLASGDIEEAEAVIGELLASGSENALAANLLGSLRHRQGRFVEAVSAYDRALEIVPDYQSALKNRALANIYALNYPAAREDLTRLVALVPEDAQVAALMGRALLETGDAEAAVGYLDIALEKMPESAIIIADKAEAMAELGYYASAINLATRARRFGDHNPDFVAYLSTVVNSWRQSESDQQAEAEAEQAKQLAEAQEAAAEEQERQQAVRDQYGIAQDTEEERAALLAEIRKLAGPDGASNGEEQELTEAELATRALRQLRNQMFGLWLAEEIGLGGNDALAYAQRVAEADSSEDGDTDLIRLAIVENEKAGKSVTVQAIEKKLAELMEAASAELESDSAVGDAR